MLTQQLVNLGENTGILYIIPATSAYLELFQRLLFEKKIKMRNLIFKTPNWEQGLSDVSDPHPTQNHPETSR